MDAIGPNSEQIRYWNDVSVQKWVGQQPTLDAQLAPYGEAAMAALALRPGAQVLDVGCGCGGTTLALAAQAGPQGQVLGVDISEPMLARARERAASAGLGHVRFATADAQTHVFDTGAFDAMFSRFGVMFFSDPTAAFTNLRQAVRAGGRLAFVCWQTLPQNPWMAVPLMAAAQHLTLPAPPSPDAPGPFAFARQERIQQILGDAGWTGVQVEAFTPQFRVSSSADLGEAVEFLLQLGPLGALLRDADAPVVSRVRESVRESLAPFHGPNGLQMASATWIVTARHG